MEQRRYAITGATGHIGHHIVEGLLKANQLVRVLGRDAGRLERFVKNGAQAHVGQPDDARYLEEAFRGADAVFTLIPPNLSAKDLRNYQNEVGKAQVKAIREAGIRYVVNLSSLGGEHADKVGPIKGLHDQEERLNQLKAVNILHLRPTYFFENLYYSLPVIKEMGVIGTPIKGDIAIPMIATRDIAKKAVERLLALDWKGHEIEELLGQRDISYTEIAEVMSQQLHMDSMKYVEFSYDDARKHMLHNGLSEDAANSLVELYHAVNEGLVHSNIGRNPQNTTETPIEEFLEEFKQALAA